MAWIRRLSPARGDVSERTMRRRSASRPCTHSASISRRARYQADLEDRPQKSPRACVIASDPPRLVHLITRAQGGLHDYEAFLHEAGHALHYAGCDPTLPLRSGGCPRPCADGDLLVPARLDRPRARMACASTSGSPRRRPSSMREARAFRRPALPSLHGEARLRARLLGALPRRRRHAGGYEERLTAATGIRYPAEEFLADMDAGFYSADYLRAWIRAAQLRTHLRREVGEDWWRAPETGDFLRASSTRAPAP